MLVVLSGKGRSGKDTAAKMLMNILGDCQVIAYADYLKEILINCFDLSWDDMYNGQMKEQPIEGLPIRTRSGNVTTHCWTPRKLLQYIGTDIFRTINPNCWINVVQNKVKEGLYDNYVVSDARFPNEIDWVLESGGLHIKIEREDKDFVSGTDHSSETSLDNFKEGPSSFVICNNKDLSYLESELIKTINKWRSRQWQTKSTH